MRLIGLAVALTLVLTLAPLAPEAQTAGKVPLLKTAKAIGVTIPPSVLGRADRVIR